MPKRKRDGPERLTNSHQPNAKAVEEKIHHGKKLLHRALKVAKGFERQKLGKRQKTAQQNSNNADITRIGAEIRALRNLDLHVAAEAHLYKTLLKEKAVLNSALLPEYVRTAVKPSFDASTANVTARLYNSHPVKDAVAEALPLIRRALGLESGHKVSKGSRVVREEPRQKPPSTVTDGELVETDLDASLNSEEEAASQKLLLAIKNGKLQQDEDELDEDYAMMDARVASGSEEDDRSEVEGDASREKRRYKPEVDLSLSPSPSVSPSPPPITKATRKPPKGSNPPSSATYLPSLTMGGFYSGSESGSEPEADIEQATNRKNRRGQRARQKIWEQKFGGRAKHVQQNMQGQGKSQGRSARDEGWDFKRGAQPERNGPEKGRFQPRWKTDRSQGGRNGDARHGGRMWKPAENHLQGKSAPQQSDKPLHPSWEAARKAKEQRQTGKSGGTKVVFD